MANTFARTLFKLTSTSATTVYTTPASTVTLVKSVYCSNILGSNTTVDVYITSGGSDYYLIKNGLLPSTTTLQVITEPVVLTASDLLVVKAADANAVDVTTSYMTIT